MRSPVIVALGLLIPWVAAADMAHVPFVDRIAESDGVVMVRALPRGADAGSEISFQVEKALKGEANGVLELNAQRFYETEIPLPITRRVLVLISADGNLAGAYPEGSWELKHAVWIVEVLSSGTETPAFDAAMKNLKPDEVQWLNNEVMTARIPERVRAEYLQLVLQQATPAWEYALLPVPTTLQLSEALPALLQYLERGRGSFRSAYPIEQFRQWKDPLALPWLLSNLETARAKDDANAVPRIVSVLRVFSPEAHACVLRQLEREGVYPASSVRHRGDDVKWIKEEQSQLAASVSCDDHPRQLFPTLDAANLGRKLLEGTDREEVLFQLSVRAEPAAAAAGILLDRARSAPGPASLPLVALAGHALRRARTLPPTVLTSYERAVHKALTSPYGEGVEAVVVAVADDAVRRPDETAQLLSDAWGTPTERDNALLVVTRLDLSQVTSAFAARLGKRLMEVAESASGASQLNALGSALAALAPASPEILKSVEARLNADSPSARRVGIALIAFFPQAASQDWDRVEAEADKSPDPQNRATGVATLTTLAWVTRDSARAERLLPLLWTRLEDPDANVSRAAGEALGLLTFWRNPSSALAQIPQRLAAALAQPNRSNLLAVLRGIEGANPSAFSADQRAHLGKRLGELADSKDPKVKVQAKQAAQSLTRPR